MNKLLILLLLVSLNFYGQQIHDIDVKELEANLRIDPLKKVVRGEVEIAFVVKNNSDSIAIDARKMTFSKVRLNKKEIPFEVSNTHLIIKSKFKKNKVNKVCFSYEAHPKSAMYFIDWNFKGNNGVGKKQIWTQGQGKYTSNWLPSFDDMNEKLIFNLNITFDKNYEVIANGKLIRKKAINDKELLWKYRMTKPMSSYLVALAIGKYAYKEEKSTSGTPLYMYYYPEDESKFESTYRYTARIFNYLETEIGVPYPWQNYKQIPVKDFLYAGMENTGTTIFSDAFVVDTVAFKNKNYVNVNAHELAHQWFGNLVTETHGTHHWLHEGFATYYALLAEKEVFGKDYYYHNLYKTANQLMAAQKNDTIPLKNPKASSLTFYQKGAWALHILREQVGNAAFKQAVTRYLNQNQFKNVETNDFLGVLSEISKKDLTAFEETWLESAVLDETAMKKSLAKNASVRCLLNLNDSITVSEDCTLDDRYLTEKLFSIQKDSIAFNSLRQKLLKSSHIKARTALSGIPQRIPVTQQQAFEKLLDDPSYTTVENALFNLWNNFPLKRKTYLLKTQHKIGYNDKNIRILWLALTLNTEGFNTQDYQSYYNELVRYTDPMYHFEVRRNAFLYLSRIKAFNSNAYSNLEDGTQHHNWRFRSFCSKLKKELDEQRQNTTE